MSRSTRKPYYGNAPYSKWWKGLFNRVLRRKNIDISDGNEYKKLNEVYCSPMERAHGYWDVQQLRRK